MINVSNQDVFKSELTFALLQLDWGEFFNGINYKNLDSGKIEYCRWNGLFVLKDRLNEVKKFLNTADNYLKDKAVDKNSRSHLTSFQLIQKAIKDQVIFDNGYHYHLIPKGPLDLIFHNKLGYVKSELGVVVGVLKPKTTTIERGFRDNEDTVKFDNRNYDFLAVFDGSRCYIFIETDSSNKCDLMIKCNNPWQLNKYFTVKSVDVKETI